MDLSKKSVKRKKFYEFCRMGEKQMDCLLVLSMLGDKGYLYQIADHLREDYLKVLKNMQVLCSNELISSTPASKGELGMKYYWIEDKDLKLYLLWRLAALWAMSESNKPPKEILNKIKIEEKN